MKSESPPAASSAENLESPAPEAGLAPPSPSDGDKKGSDPAASMVFSDGIWKILSIRCGGTQVWPVSGQKNSRNHMLEVKNGGKNFYYSYKNRRNKDVNYSATFKEKANSAGLITAFTLQWSTASGDLLQDVEYTLLQESTLQESTVELTLRSQRGDFMFCKDQQNASSEVQLVKSEQTDNLDSP